MTLPGVNPYPMNWLATQVAAKSEIFGLPKHLKKAEVEPSPLALRYYLVDWLHLREAEWAHEIGFRAMAHMATQEWAAPELHFMNEERIEGNGDDRSADREAETSGAASG